MSFTVERLNQSNVKNGNSIMESSIDTPPKKYLHKTVPDIGYSGIIFENLLDFFKFF